MWWIRMLLLAIVLIVLLGLAMQNISEDVEITIWKWHWTGVPLILVIYLAFVGGVVVWFLATAFHDFQLRSKLRGEHRRVKRLQEELAALRNLPLEEPEQNNLSQLGGEEG